MLATVLHATETRALEANAPGRATIAQALQDAGRHPLLRAYSGGGWVGLLPRVTRGRDESGACVTVVRWLWRWRDDADTERHIERLVFLLVEIAGCALDNVSLDWVSITSEPYSPEVHGALETWAREGAQFDAVPVHDLEPLNEYQPAAAPAVVLPAPSSGLGSALWWLGLPAGAWAAHHYRKPLARALRDAIRELERTPHHRRRHST